MRLLACLLLLSSVALAERPAHFADKGGIVLTNEFQSSLGYLNFSADGGSSGAFSLQLRPSADYFIANQLSVGGLIGLSVLAGSGNTGANFEINPRVGFALPLNGGMSLWPKFGLQLTTGDLVLGPLVAQGLSQTTFGITLDVPFLWHVTDHFFVGVGPKIVAQFVGDLKQTSALLAFTLGGWL